MNLLKHFQLIYQSQLNSYKSKALMSFLVAIFVLISLIGCSPFNNNNQNHTSDDTNKSDGNNEVVKIVYVEWASEIASANVVKTVIENRLGYTTELLPVSTISMWESIAAGDQDGMVAAWMPSLHEEYYNEHQDQIEDLGPNLEGAIMGLAVPEYLPINSIDELSEYRQEFDQKIIGIDPGAGIMAKTNQVLDEYHLNQFELITGSDATMTQTLENAIEEERWIVVTGWNPHWKFARWDLKYLEDPKNVYGKEEYISTIVRKDLQEDKPDVYNFLDRFYWTPSDMEQVMLWAREDNTTPEQAAKRWVEENQKVVDTWIE